MREYAHAVGKDIDQLDLDDRKAAAESIGVATDEEAFYLFIAELEGMSTKEIYEMFCSPGALGEAA